MRKIEIQMLKEMNSLFYQNEAGTWRKDNTRVTRHRRFHSTHIYLFDNEIAELRPDGELCITNCGFFTVTTKSRINAILENQGRKWHIYQKNKHWYLKNSNTGEQIEVSNRWITFRPDGSLKEY